MRSLMQRVLGLAQDAAISLELQKVPHRYVDTYIYIYIYKYIRIHAYVYTYMYVFMFIYNLQVFYKTYTWLPPAFL